MKLEPFDKTGCIGIWGGRGSGKTTFAREHITPQLTGQRVAIIDPGAEAGKGHKTAQSFASALYAGEKRVILSTSSASEAVPAIYAAYCHSSKSDPIYLICDEAPAYLDKVTDGLSKIMFQGRHRAFGMAVLGQRVSAVHAQIRSQLSTSFFFRLNDHVDIDVARKLIGPAAQNLPNHQPGEFIRHPF